jgi:NTE family protein
MLELEADVTIRAVKIRTQGWDADLRFAVMILLVLFGGCGMLPRSPEPVSKPVPDAVIVPPKPEVMLVPPKIALSLGGGGARGFAHIGVIKALEAHGIVPDIVIGTSAGSLVGALYAGGYHGFDLQRVALQIDDTVFADWSLPDRGFIRGQALQNFVNSAVQNRPLEKLNMPFATLATDLQSGEPIVFRSGNTGMAVRASSSVPGVFQPVTINGREYVDGGLVSPVPVRAARAMGADLVIAVYISNNPRFGKTKDTVDLMLQTFAIMGQSIAGYELTEADIVIRPGTDTMRGTDFDNRNLAIMEGEKAGFAAIAAIKHRITEKTVSVAVTKN